jgi:hypothetical protein
LELVTAVVLPFLPALKVKGFSRDRTVAAHAATAAGLEVAAVAVLHCLPELLPEAFRTGVLAVAAAAAAAAAVDLAAVGAVLLG